MKDRTTNDNAGLFRQPSDTPVSDDRSVEVDDSVEAMRRLRSPFEVRPADGNPPRNVPAEEDADHDT
jgi:hypothetical protein